MTTSRQTEDLNHPAIRELVNLANAMPLSDRVTLLKALIPEVAREMSPREFENVSQFTSAFSTSSWRESAHRSNCSL